MSLLQKLLIPSCAINAALFFTAMFVSLPKALSVFQFVFGATTAVVYVVWVVRNRKAAQ